MTRGILLLHLSVGNTQSSHEKKVKNMNRQYRMTVLRWPPVHFLGQLSLEIYLLHDPVAKIAIFNLLMPQVIKLITQTSRRNFFPLPETSFTGGRDNYFWLWLSDNGALLLLLLLFAVHQKQDP